MSEPFISATTTRPEIGARSMRTKACSSRPMAEHGVCRHRYGVTAQRSRETGGRSRRGLDGWFGKEQGEATTKSLGTSAADESLIARAINPALSIIGELRRCYRSGPANER